MPVELIDNQNLIPGFMIREKVILELGSGLAKQILEAITVDMLNIEGSHVVCNLDEGLTFLKDNSIDAIYSFHFLEHVKNVNLMMKEIYWVLKKGDKNIGADHYFANPYFYNDPTHKTTFGLYTFSYFSKSSYFKRGVPAFYNDVNFQISRIEYRFRSKFFIRHWIKNFFEKLFNSNKYMKEFYDEQLCYLLPVYELYFELEKK